MEAIVRRRSRRTPHDSTRIDERRRFLRCAALGAAATALPLPLRADPYAPLPAGRTGPRVRVRGQCRSGGQGLAGVPISDGLSVIETAADGSFELLTHAGREFVQISVPSGFAIPRNPTGTGRFYRSIRPDASGEAVFELQPLPRSDEHHALFLLADVQTQDEDEMSWFHGQTVPDVLALAAELDPVEKFGVACGDIMYDNLGLYSKYEQAVGRMGLPFFQVVGNHDLDQEELVDTASTRTFCRHFGPRYYSFDRGAVHYVVLDDVFWHGQGYFGYLDQDQLEWLRADLARLEAGRTVIVALHIPVLGSSHVRQQLDKPAIGVSVTNRELLYRLLEPFNAHILAGHMHESEHGFSHGVHEHVSATVCGAWWSGPICADGAPSGYSLYEIRGEEVTWRYKSTGMPLDHQMRLYPHGADPAAPDEIVANVWDWDPQWQVLWYEDGERKGQMSRRTGHDPLSVELHEGPELPPRRKWVEPYLTAHLFYAAASRDARRITVEATDRFGRVYATDLR
jgi:hypothetical protein